MEAACAYLGALDREAFLTTVAPSLRGRKLSDGITRYDRHELDAWVDGYRGPRRSDDDWLSEL
jgi:hypothetical protein